MKKRLHDKKAGIAILSALIIISLAEIIFRAAVVGESILATANLGEQLAVVVLAATILVLNAKGKDRACYILYGAWVAYFVLDQLFELPGVVIGTINQMTQAGTISVALEVGAIIRILSMVGIIAIGVLLLEYMNVRTICIKVFNGLFIATVLLLIANIGFSIHGAVIAYSTFILDTFNALYRMNMVFLLAFFAYDSANMQLTKAKISK